MIIWSILILVSCSIVGPLGTSITCWGGVLQYQVRGTDSSECAPASQRAARVTSDGVVKASGVWVRSQDQVLDSLLLVRGAQVDYLVANKEMQFFNQLFRFAFHLSPWVVEHLVGQRKHQLVDLASTAMVTHVVYKKKVSRQTNTRIDKQAKCQLLQWLFLKLFSLSLDYLPERWSIRIGWRRADYEY